MAYVRERGDRWYLGYKDRKGAWVEAASKARTKTEAKRLADELERKEERIRLGIDEAPPEAMTFAVFAKRWQDDVAKNKRGYRSLESRLRVHLLPEFGELL